MKKITLTIYIKLRIRDVAIFQEMCVSVCFWIESQSTWIKCNVGVKASMRFKSQLNRIAIWFCPSM